VTMTLAARGKHRADDRIADLEARIRVLEADNQALIEANENLVQELAATIISASSHSMRAAVAEEENGRLKVRVRELGDKVIRAGAEHQRLRQAVINARPKITVAYQQPDRPYVSDVVLPYAVPVGRSTASDETQQLPVIDLPQHTH
jgi:hypothetical protein